MSQTEKTSIERGITEEQEAQPAADARWRSMIPAWLRKLFAAVVGLFLFILALQLLKKGASESGKPLLALLNVRNPANALGFGWLCAYIMLSGSPVAAIAISFFASGVLTATGTFMMIT